MEELPLEPEVARDAVDGVAGDRKLERLEVDADLVRPPRLEPHVEQRPLAEPLAHLEPRDRLARRVGVERVPRPVATIAADRGGDAPRARARRSADEREVAAIDRALADRRSTAARAPRPSGRRRAVRRCRGRAGGRSRAAPGPRPRRRARAARAPASRSGARRRDARRGPRACRPRAGARPRTRPRAPSPRARAPRAPGRRPRAPPHPRAGSSSDAPYRRRARRPRSGAARRASASRRPEAPRGRRRGADRRRSQRRESGDVPTVALERSAATNERKSSPTPTTMNVSARLNAGQ